MKYGIRKPNIKKRISARTTGRTKRVLKKSVNPLYGKKGMGMINNPKKAVYNKVYNKTTVSADDIAKTVLHNSSAKIKTPEHPAPPTALKTNFVDIQHEKTEIVNTDKLRRQVKLWLMLTVIILLLSIAFSITGIFAIVAGIICWTKYTKLKRGNKYEEKRT